MHQSKINLNTLVPLSLVVAFLGGSFWLGVLYHEVQQGQVQNQQTLKVIEDFRAEYKSDFQYLNSKFDKFLLSQAEKKVALLDQK